MRGVVVHCRVHSPHLRLPPSPFTTPAPTSQNAIYYLCAPNRELAEASPYFEAFKRHNKEVIFVYNAIDDFVMANLRTYHGRCVACGVAWPDRAVDGWMDGWVYG